MPNSDLISRAELIEKYGDWYVEEGIVEGYIGSLETLISDMPAVDAAPVRHGRWIKLSEAPDWDQRRCSVCGEVCCCQGKYCMGCGALMDGGDNNGKEKN